MLDLQLTQQLRTHLASVTLPVELVATLDGSASSESLASLLEEIAALSPMISVRRDGDASRRPSFAIRRAGTDVQVEFAGVPLGHEFTSLVLALLHVGGHPPKVSAEVAEQIRNLPGDYHFETFYSLSCQNCPDVVQALNVMSVINPRVRHIALDGALFRAEVEERGVMAVPSVFLDGVPFSQGRSTLEQLLAQLDSGAAERQAADLAAKETFDVLVVGGGPAGAAAAVYAARKGIRTGLVAERFGGQVLDTMGIENFISVPRTEGPRLAASLEQHVHDYDVDVMNLQRAVKLVPPPAPGGPLRVELASGAELSARTVVVSTGARWRTMGVPGEDEYRNRGVTFCPHCDGPLFKGKRVAVIGGGNSGVEAAIDLAGLAESVTLLEFASELRADAVLVDRLNSLRNTTVITDAATTEVVGDGSRVVGLRYLDRTDGTEREVAVDGVFVQIGLVPNTAWLDGVVELSPRGEVVVDPSGATSVPGVFAAGDATTTPYKQIVIAMGAGATAALAAFDHLVRQPTG